MIKRGFRFPIGSGLLLAVLLAMPVQAQQSSYGTDGDRGSASTGTNDTYMETRVSDLETQMRTLNGRLEQAEWQNKKLQNQLDKLQGDLELRLGVLEHGGAAQAAVAPPPTLSTPTAMLPVQKLRATGNPNDDTITRLTRNVHGEDDAAETPPVQPVMGKLGNLYVSPNNQVTGADQVAVKPALPKPPANAQDQYDQAFSLLRNADYDHAETAFKSFLSKYPKDKLIDNAKYWLGETYYARNQFDAAAVAFADAYQTAPKGSKAPDSLLKLGLALAGLKKTDDACTTLTEVNNRYPNASTSVKSHTTQEMKRLKCKS